MTRSKTYVTLVAAAVAAGLVAAACGSSKPGPPPATSAPPPSQQPTLSGIHKIRHVVIIFQENRSFDAYFGTYPGADGIPMRAGRPTACVPDPATRRCVRPFLDHADENGGGPHDAVNSAADIAGGKMDGFIAEAQKGRRHCADPTDPACTHSAGGVDVMGYHDGTDLPNYWAYARHFVLQDHMFESVHSWSFPSHLYLVSGWAANCRVPSLPSTCSSSVDPTDRTRSNPTPFGWTDLTYLLAKHHVSWGWYLDHGAMPAPGGGRGRKKKPFVQRARNPHGAVPVIWNVLPGFVDVHQDRQVTSIQGQSAFAAAARSGNLPAVSWLLPDIYDSEHPPALVSVGQSYVTNLVNEVMRSPEWDSTAIFVTWDDWGGFYDQVRPPAVDGLGYGIRVPGLVISPYAKAGYVDHQTLSFDAYLKFIEDDFVGGARLDPRTDGRPDPRPDVRENLGILGNLVQDFDFSQKPRPPMILPTSPRTSLVCPGGGHPGAMGACPGRPVGGSG